MDTQKYIDALNDRLNEADPNEVLIIADAIEDLKEGDLGSTLLTLNRLDLWLGPSSPWRDKIRDVYNAIRADIIQKEIKTDSAAASAVQQKIGEAK